MHRYLNKNAWIFNVSLLINFQNSYVTAVCFNTSGIRSEILSWKYYVFNFILEVVMQKCNFLFR